MLLDFSSTVFEKFEKVVGLAASCKNATNKRVVKALCVHLLNTYKTCRCARHHVVREMMMKEC